MMDLICVGCARRIQNGGWWVRWMMVSIATNSVTRGVVPVDGTVVRVVPSVSWHPNGEIDDANVSKMWTFHT